MMMFLLMYLFIITPQTFCTIIEGPSNFTYLPNVTTLPIELTCNVTGVALWRVNHADYSLFGLTNGNLPGHNRSGTNILVDSPVNNTEYICLSQTNNGGVLSDPAYIIIAGVPSVVPNAMINGTYILSWGEPFNNLDPIVNYTVSCSGNVTCPPNFTTTDNTTRSYTITNLTPMTNYRFSVVATNSIGSGEAGVVMITTPPDGANSTSINSLSIQIGFGACKTNTSTPDKVPDVMVNQSSKNITRILSWGEPFSYFSPIINYTVSCSLTAECPPDFTTPDNTTRSYTIANMTPMTVYEFSVVATNFFGNGEAGVVNITIPAIPDDDKNSNDEDNDGIDSSGSGSGDGIGNSDDSSDDSNDENTTAAAIGGGLAALILGGILVAVLCLFFRYYRKNNKNVSVVNMKTRGNSYSYSCNSSSEVTAYAISGPGILSTAVSTSSSPNSAMMLQVNTQLSTPPLNYTEIQWDKEVPKSIKTDKHVTYVETKPI